jgi:hypothetical protein
LRLVREALFFRLGADLRRELLAFRGGARRGWRGAHVFALADE